MIDPKLLAFLRARLNNCPLCKWMLEDLELHGKFTKDYPKNQNLSSPLFPIEAKPSHLVLEGVELLEGIEKVRLPEGAPLVWAPSTPPDGEKLW